jgi:hypothetical protein
MKDKNILGMDFFCSPHPVFSTPEEIKEAWERFEKRKEEGFPCKDYISVNDMVKVQHGHWIYNGNSWDGREWVMCSNCERHSFLRTNYCPHCGAKMDEANNDSK